MPARTPVATAELSLKGSQARKLLYLALEAAHEEQLLRNSNGFPLGDVMNPVRAKLVEDHEMLDALLVQLAEEAEDSDRPALQSTWSDFEKRLIAHIDAEERYLLPLIEADNPSEVAQTRREHGEIRDLIAELGLAIELHTAREPDIRRLGDSLRAHAKREEAALYSIAGDKASVSVEHGITTTLKSVVRSALRVTGHETPSARRAATRARP